MSRSFLNPSVTPCTALATSARARPCSARCSSVSRSAVQNAVLLSRSLMPRGMATDILPLGPCTSTAPIVNLNLHARGHGNRFLSNSRHESLFLETSYQTSHKQFAAHAFLARRSARSSRPRGVDRMRNAHAADHRANLGLAHVAPAAGPRNALQIGDHAAAVGGVAQEDAQRLLALWSRPRLCRSRGSLLPSRSGRFRLSASTTANRRARACARERCECASTCPRWDQWSFVRPFRPHAYQLAFTTPGISPFSARPRKQMRHI